MGSSARRPAAASGPQLPGVCVCYLLREVAGRSQVLLGRKKKGLGLGRLVGLGGKQEPGESILDAAVREIEEEAALIVEPEQLLLRGELDYHFPDRPEWSQRSSVFIGRRWRGEPAESDELIPAWYPIDEIPFEQMWDDARLWLPRLLTGSRVRAEVRFAADLATVADYRLDLT